MKDFSYKVHDAEVQSFLPKEGHKRQLDKMSDGSDKWVW